MFPQKDKQGIKNGFLITDFYGDQKEAVIWFFIFMK